jgi:hypothetical protein
MKVQVNGFDYMNDENFFLFTSMHFNFQFLLSLTPILAFYSNCNASISIWVCFLIFSNVNFETVKCIHQFVLNNFHVISVVISPHYVGFKMRMMIPGKIWITIKNYYGNERIVIFLLRTNDDFFIFHPICIIMKSSAGTFFLYA